MSVADRSRSGHTVRKSHVGLGDMQSNTSSHTAKLRSLNSYLKHRDFSCGLPSCPWLLDSLNRRSRVTSILRGDLTEAIVTMTPPTEETEHLGTPKLIEVFA
jgi:hypothetical protein